MIVEQEIESRLVTAFSAKLAEAGLNVQVAGLLTDSDALKGAEKAGVDGVMVVKARPRSYTTPTDPECQIEVSISLAFRADADCYGSRFMDAFGLLMDTFQQWQRCMDDAHEMFSVDGAFSCTGYVLNEGDTGMEPSGKTWSYTHSMTISGVIEF